MRGRGFDKGPGRSRVSCYWYRCLLRPSGSCPCRRAACAVCECVHLRRAHPSLRGDYCRRRISHVPRRRRRRRSSGPGRFHFRRICYCLPDFAQEKNSIAFAKTVDRDCQASFSGAYLDVGNFAPDVASDSLIQTRNLLDHWRVTSSNVGHSAANPMFVSSALLPPGRVASSSRTRLL